MKISSKLTCLLTKIFLGIIFFTVFGTHHTIAQQIEKKDLLSHIEVSKHDGIGERYINMRDSIILDLHCPVVKGDVPDSTLIEVEYYQIAANGPDRENQFYWSWPSGSSFLVGSIYEGYTLESLSEKILQEYKTTFSAVHSSKSSYEEIERDNVFLLGHVDNETASYWEFFYSLYNGKIFRLSYMGRYPKKPEAFAEMNGQSQIETLLDSEEQAFLFSPEKNITNRFYGNFDPISTIAYYEKYKDNLDLEKEDQNTTMINQISALIYSFANDFENCKTHMQRYNQPTEDSKTHQFLSTLLNDDGIEYKNAKEEILKNLKDKSIFIINEHHNHPRCRAFVKDLLPELKEMGFNTFVTEGLANRLEGNYDAFEEVKKNLGFYTNESGFANLLREAKVLDYQVFSYEADHHRRGLEALKYKNPNYEGIRDSLAFENIKEIYVKEKPANEPMKMVIFCGHGHLMKSFENPAWKVIGMYLNEWKPEALYTVSQDLIPEYFKEWEDTLEALNAMEYPVTPYLEGQNYLGPFEKTYDQLVLFPKTQLVDGIPKWLLDKDENKIPVFYEGKEWKRYYASIYIKSDWEKHGAQAVPYKIFPFDYKLDQSISNKYGEYIMIIQERSGEKVEEIKL